MKPTTPLPWKQADGHFQHVTGEDLAYIIHAANAYPRLIAALREYVEVVSSVNDPNDFSAKVKDDGYHARDLLIELGEAH